MIAKFDNVSDLMSHYAAVQMRLNGPKPKPFVHQAALPLPPVVPEPEPEPEPEVPIVAPLVRMPVIAIAPHEVRISFEEVLALVCLHAGYHRREIFADRRTTHIVKSRQLLWALARKFCWHMSLPQIGRASGGKDHTTILHGCKKGVQDPSYPQLAQALEDLYEEKKKMAAESMALVEKEGV
jgi:hypothetical protein